MFDSGRNITKELNLAFEKYIKIHFYSKCDRYLPNVYHLRYFLKNLGKHVNFLHINARVDHTYTNINSNFLWAKGKKKNTDFINFITCIHPRGILGFDVLTIITS